MSPGHDGLTKEFYEHFSDDLKFYFINSLKQSKIDGNLSISERQAVIKLIAKKDRDKRFWNRRMLLLEGRRVIFKTLTVSKIVYLASLTVIPKSLVEELQKIQKTFIWHSSRPKISHKTCNNFENGGSKHVDISSKIIGLQCSWLRKHCDKNFHEWKIIPSHLKQILRKII